MRLFYALYPFLSMCVTNKCTCRCPAIQRFNFKMSNERAALGDGHTHTHTIKKETSQELPQSES